MFRYTDQICKKCFLQNDPFHKVLLNEENICSLCAKSSPKEYERDWVALEKRFVSHLDRVRGTAPYDGLIMMSGGKDSAYLADLLKNRYGMNLLCLIIDINYEYPETFSNARTIASKLDLPYVIFRQNPEIMRRYYSFLFTTPEIAQLDGGQVCTFCGRFLIQTGSSFAKRMGIPLVFSGHNPDQIFLMGESIQKTQEQEILIEFIMEILSEETDKSLEIWRKNYGEPTLPLFPDSIHAEDTELLFPFQYFPYRPEAMMEHVKEHLGWLPIKRFSKTYIASGCRLVKLWAYISYLNNTNSYVDFELCNQIRNGSLSSETVRKFYAEAEVDYKELAALVVELDIVEPMKVMLAPYGVKSEQLLCLLP